MSVFIIIIHLSIGRTETGFSGTRLFTLFSNITKVSSSELLNSSLLNHEVIFYFKNCTTVPFSVVPHFYFRTFLKRLPFGQPKFTWINHIYCSIFPHSCCKCNTQGPSITYYSGTLTRQKIIVDCHVPPRGAQCKM